MATSADQDKDKLILNALTNIANRASIIGTSICQAWDEPLAHVPWEEWIKRSLNG